MCDQLRGYTQVLQVLAVTLAFPCISQANSRDIVYGTTHKK